MCGHVGIFGHISPKLFYMFEVLLNLDLQRGTDSTGIAFVNNKGEVDVIKDTVLPFELMRTPDYVRNMNAKNVCIIGHNRAATVGGVNRDNAHPHDIGRIVLAHNGSLPKYGKELLPDHELFTNDSKNLTHSINKIGIDETWKITNGAATLVYWDRQLNNLNFISNKQRPFHYIITPDSRTLIWSSCDKILKEAMKMCDVKAAGKGDGDMYELVSSRLVSFSIGKKGGIVYSTKDLEPFSHKNWFPASDQKVVGVNGYWREGKWTPFSDNYRGRQETYTGSISAFGNADKVPPKGDAKRRMDQDEFHKTYTHCSMCGSSLDHEYEDAMIVDSKHAVCGDCVKVAFEMDMRIV